MYLSLKVPLLLGISPKFGGVSGRLHAGLRRGRSGGAEKSGKEEKQASRSANKWEGGKEAALIAARFFRPGTTGKWFRSGLVAVLQPALERSHRVAQLVEALSHRLDHPVGVG